MESAGCSWSEIERLEQFHSQIIFIVDVNETSLSFIHYHCTGVKISAQNLTFHLPYLPSFSSSVELCFLFFFGVFIISSLFFAAFSSVTSLVFIFPLAGS